MLFLYISEHLMHRRLNAVSPTGTIIPVMIGSFYQFHPLAVSDPMRSRASIALLWLWSVRLTHSYFRRCGSGCGIIGDLGGSVA